MRKGVRTMKPTQILSTIVLAALLASVPMLLMDRLGSLATAEEQPVVADEASGQPTTEAAKEPELAPQRPSGEISQKLTAEPKDREPSHFLSSEQQPATDTETLKDMQSQDEMSAKSF
jgi:hypothetical protein